MWGRWLSGWFVMSRWAGWLWWRRRMFKVGESEHGIQFRAKRNVMKSESFLSYVTSRTL
jgi:hypothetical protein